jgi:hypothetical protein
MPSRNDAKRLTDFKYLCVTIENICKHPGDDMFSSIHSLRVEDANKMFLFAEQHLALKELTAKVSEKSRPSQLAWTTMVKYLRSYKDVVEYKDILPTSKSKVS